MKTRDELDRPELDTPLWRHVDLAQFAWMLLSGSIWFTRVAALEDKFEGSYPVPTAERIRAISATVDVVELPAEIGVEYIPSYSQRTLGSLRERVYVNCWYSGRHESAALWQWAERKGQSVALRSTFGRLNSSVKSGDEIYPSRVRYLNYQKEPVPFRHKLGVFFCKRKSFEHEHEVRLLIERPEDAPHLGGVAATVDLTHLLQQVVVAPGAPTWHTEVVKSLLVRYGLPTVAELVRKSELDKDPIY